MVEEELDSDSSTSSRPSRYRCTASATPVSVEVLKCGFSNHTCGMHEYRDVWTVGGSPMKVIGECAVVVLHVVGAEVQL